MGTSSLMFASADSSTIDTALTVDVIRYLFVNINTTWVCGINQTLTHAQLV